MTTEAPPPTTNNALAARELEWAINSPALLEEHAAINKGIVRTRFPPEPNGYLHIGHAKSMNMNFRLAFEKLGVPMEQRRTIFRYDDTNPDAESPEYIDSLRRDLAWLGWEPERTTYSSDNFQTLYELAVKLIEKGLAYVCDMTKAEMEAQRDLAKRRSSARAVGKDPDLEAPIPSSDILPGRNRETSVERNLKLFEEMKLGLHEEGSLTLRLKMDFESANPNMYDLVAYRIRYTPHPHAGKGWCIYPNYDFTHGICDSLERIDYSICTLEFETRREPYYWILWALDMYRPKVYEMSRLNLEYTVLSKRRLLKLVNAKYVRGWDDPRMPTISGLRRRGYTKEIINNFCNDVGATRAMNVVEMAKLFQVARTTLADNTRRAMAVLTPIKVVITNFDEEAVKVGEGGMTFEVQNSPTDPSYGSHTVTLTQTIYIDSEDFRLEDDSSYFRLSPNQPVGLKYHGGNLICDDIVKDGDKIKELTCHLDSSEGRPKPKSHITWVPSDGITCEVRVYNHLFTEPEPSDRWEEELNPASEIVHPNAIVDPSVLELVDKKDVDKWKSNQALQFERLGYFVVDTDTTFDSLTKAGKLVFNRTVSLKEDKAVKKISDAEAKEKERRAEQQRKDAAARDILMTIDPTDFFKLAPEYKGKFSQYDETGLPTHNADGSEVTKSGRKKLEKERVKHAKKFGKGAKN
ncbi:hypothetical protein HJC23_003286 [Cyclotella cryptica]|uniref:glutamine--tRNA ligase n=1 Tax=Cyclotella cryptica TaxID=29204 RepID=A0ABD3QXU5_9STRA|eukprot:CCRYP_000832-RA/>CCRYP_000832-RA protein AED:0.10 eAED:0.10 QI:0/-1/0/1/-1/1/1/0/690